MISHLSIQGLAIIDQLSIDFTAGFNVITGETGAGKSILIRGLNFLMGGKTTTEAIRQGFDCATVVGEFLVPRAHPALAVLGRLGIGVEEGGERLPILIRRQLTQRGRSQSWVNDVPVTSPSLRELGATLVDIFGQHENQRLMDPSRHTDYLDDFLEPASGRGEVAALYRECHALTQGLERTLTDFCERDSDRDYLAFRLEALKKFNPSEEDFVQTEAVCREADASGKWREGLARALSLLDGDGDALNPGRCVRDAGKILAHLGEDPRLAGLAAAAENLSAQLDDLSYEVGRLVSDLDFDPQAIEAAQSRLYGYQDLFRRHNAANAAGLEREKERIEAELNFLEGAARQLEDALLTLEEKAGALAGAAATLTQARARAAKTIREKVERELHELAMPGSRLEVRFLTARRTCPSLDFAAVAPELTPVWDAIAIRLEAFGEGGAERGEFQLASNPGEPFLPLARVASGGEMSRIMLALKKALVADAETCVLVFDEIDSGISGRIADVVGHKMQELARGFQVICISHLPQVAVYADTHFLVRKMGAKSKRTESTIVHLTREESASEVARLLSGAEVSLTSLAHAKSLIERARAAPIAKAPKRRPIKKAVRRSEARVR